MVVIGVPVFAVAAAASALTILRGEQGELLLARYSVPFQVMLVRATSRMLFPLRAVVCTGAFRIVPAPLYTARNAAATTQAVGPEPLTFELRMLGANLPEIPHSSPRTRRKLPRTLSSSGGERS